MMRSNKLVWNYIGNFKTPIFSFCTEKNLQTKKCSTDNIFNLQIIYLTLFKNYITYIFTYYKRPSVIVNNGIFIILFLLCQILIKCKMDPIGNKPYGLIHKRTLKTQKNENNYFCIQNILPSLSCIVCNF